jgi:hypothetical protein
MSYKGEPYMKEIDYLSAVNFVKQSVTGFDPEQGLSEGAVTTICEELKKATAVGLEWPILQYLSDGTLRISWLSGTRVSVLDIDQDGACERTKPDDLPKGKRFRN